MSSLIYESCQFVLKHLEQGKTAQEILDIVKNDAEQAVDGNVNFNYFDEALSFYLQISQSKSPKSTQEREHVFDLTLSAFDLENCNSILRNDLHALIKYDKIFYSENVPFFSQLFLALYYIYEHKKKLELLNTLKCEESLLKRSIAGAKSKNIHEVISPRLNTFHEAFELTQCENIQKFQKLYKDFQDKPLMMDIMLREINRIPQEAIQNSEFLSLQEKLFIPSRSFLNSSETRLEPDDIFESLAISLFFIYRSNSYWNKLMQNSEVLSASRITKSVNTILEHILEMNNANFNYSHVMRETQEKASLFDLPLYEFRTKKNYKQHPVFEVPLSKDFQGIFGSD